MKAINKRRRTVVVLLMVGALICGCLPSVFSGEESKGNFAVAPLPTELAVGEGQYATVTAEVTAPAGTALRYQWYFANGGSTRFRKASITTATYAIKMTPERDERRVYCVITDGRGRTVTTGITTLKMAITITRQPKDTYVAVGQKARVTVRAGGRGPLTYRWYYAPAGTSDFRLSSVNGDTYRVTMTEERAGRQVYCVITDGVGRAVTSKTATLWCPVTQPLTITQQPKNASAKRGQAVKSTVYATGVGRLTYRWYYFDEAGKRFQPSSVTSATYQTVMNEVREGRRVYCEITDSAGQKAHTQVVVLSMEDPITITRQPQDATARQGDIVSTGVEATGQGLTYRWYIRKAGATGFVLSSVTSPTYSARMSETANGRQAYCVITDSRGNTATTKLVTLYDATACVFGEEIPVGKTDRGYQFKKVCQICGKTETVYYDALLSFVDDDAKMQAMLHWERIIDATGIKMTAALIGKQVTDETDYDTWSAYAGWDLLSRMQEKGVEFVHHSYNHVRLTTLSEEELHRDFQQAIAALEQYGLESSLLVYPFNAHNDLVDGVAAQYFEAAFCGKNQIITDLADPYGLTRVNVNDNSCDKLIPFTKDVVVQCKGIKQLPTLKKELEQALAAKGWLVCLSHAYDSPSGQYYFDRHAEQTLIDFCHHAQTLGRVKIVTLTEGLLAAQEIEE